MSNKDFFSYKNEFNEYIDFFEKNLYTFYHKQIINVLSEYATFDFQNKALARDKLNNIKRQIQNTKKLLDSNKKELLRKVEYAKRLL